jgi:hypothetical protein
MRSKDAEVADSAEAEAAAADSAEAVAVNV